MAQKRRSGASKGNILEMTRETLTYQLTTSAVTTLTTLDLDLLPDEIAEIRRIESTVCLNWSAETDGYAQAVSALNTDPGTAMGDLIVETAAIQQAQYEDLELIFYHRVWEQQNLTTSGLIMHNQVHEKIVDFMKEFPYLVGSNLGWNICAVEGTDIAGAVQAFMTIYFTRRRATVTELNQILLKRR